MNFGLATDAAGQMRIALGVLPLLVAALYYALWHRQASADVALLQVHYHELTTRNDAARPRSDPTTIRKLQDRLALYEQHAQRLEQLIPLREQVPELLYNITERSQEVGVDHALIKPESEQPGEHYVRQSYALRVVGTYHAIGRFLAEIGSLPRIVIPTQLVLTWSGNVQAPRAQGVRLQADFKIHTYVMPVDSLRAPTSARSAVQEH